MLLTAANCAVGMAENQPTATSSSWGRLNCSSQMHFLLGYVYRWCKRENGA